MKYFLAHEMSDRFNPDNRGTGDFKVMPVNLLLKFVVATYPIY
jgi:hypothetical protein